MNLYITHMSRRAGEVRWREGLHRGSRAGRGLWACRKGPHGVSVPKRLSGFSFGLFVYASPKQKRGTAYKPSRGAVRLFLDDIVGTLLLGCGSHGKIVALGSLGHQTRISTAPVQGQKVTIGNQAISVKTKREREGNELPDFPSHHYPPPRLSPTLWRSTGQCNHHVGASRFERFVVM